MFLILGTDAEVQEEAQYLLNSLADYIHTNNLIILDVDQPLYSYWWKSSISKSSPSVLSFMSTTPFASTKIGGKSDMERTKCTWWLKITSLLLKLSGRLSSTVGFNLSELLSLKSFQTTTMIPSTKSEKSRLCWLHSTASSQVQFISYLPSRFLPFSRPLKKSRNTH